MASKSERTRLTPKLISLAVASCFATGAALANPTGPTVVNGQVTINQAGNLLSITNSPNAIINWNGFSISAGEITRFIQQNPSSAVLNRVVGGVRSDILGALQSRMLDGVTSGGRVFLINPSGIVFGPGSQIDVGGLVASTLALSNEDFLGGRLRFAAEPGAGSVINNGAINTATGGQVYLVGTSVTNNGIITSPKGEVILAAGNSVELVNPGTPNLRVEITASDNEAKNLNQIVADAGRVGIYAGLITHSGTTRADSAIATEDGRIVLRATKNTTIEAGSVISASGPSGGQVTIQSGDTTLVSGSIAATGSAGKGGTVEVLGNLVGLIDNASIDVSGAAGGGTALVGGDFQGKNPNVQNAFRTYFGPNAKINANAIGNGDGGTVIVWSDDSTRAYGTISARGGSESGNGGFAEVSGKRWLDFHAAVDTSAPKGRTGTLLLDPADVCIHNGNLSLCPGGGGGNGFLNSGGNPSIFTSSSSQESLLQWGTIGSTLSSNNVIVTTSNGNTAGTGNINIVEDSPDLASSNMLMLVAHNDVNVGRSDGMGGGRIWNTGSGELRIYAGWNEGATPVGSLAGASMVAFADAPAAIGLTNQGSINVNRSIDMSGNTLLRAGNSIDIASGQKVDITVPCCSDNRSLSLVVDAGNAVTMTNAILKVDLSGGEGGSAAIRVRAGGGGVTVNGTGPGGYSMFASGGGSFSSSIAGGTGTIQVGTQEQPVTGPINLTNANIQAQGGYGNGTNGGDAKVEFVGGSIMVNSSSIYAYAGGAGNNTAGIGGSGLIQMASAGDIGILNSDVSSNGNSGDGGGGSGQFVASAAGSINVQNSFVGAEGHSGSFARVLMGANGSISIGSQSSINARGNTSSMQANGTAAEVTVIGNSILINGFSIMGAEGASGTVNGGAASMNLIAAAGMAQAVPGSSGFNPGIPPAGPITLGDSSGPAALLVLAGDGPTRGGDAALTIVAGGPLAVTDSFGIINGGFGDGASSAGGNASMVLGSSTAGVTLTRSHFGAIGGSGDMTGGSAVSIVAAGGGDLLIDGTGSSSSGPPILVETFFSQGGNATGLGGIGGTAETNTFSAGMTRVNGDHAYAQGGDASQGRGGDANFFGIAGSGFEMLNAEVGPFGGFGGQQGGAALLGIAAATFRVESTGSSTSSPATLLSYGGSTGTSGTPGSANAALIVTSPTGSVDIINDKLDVIGGRRGSGTSAPYGPGNILLTFKQRTAGGFSVNGVEGAITGSPVGFFVNEQPAIPDVNFFIVYEGITSLPSFLEQTVIGLNDAVTNLIPNREDTAPTQEEKDKKKKESECK